MSVITLILGTLVALEFLYIFYLETIATTSSKTRKTFNLSKVDMESKSLQVLFKNQGVYNGLIALLLFYSLYLSHAAKEITSLILMYILLVACYGAVTSDKRILLKQGGLAILTLLSLIFLG
ncbi:DUF1304 domain-containing protein [uncultured Enterococcus sp.]|uniref:DUF1304 domain-containing protein n=1 Tax=uncultured Enterococcus sp. TaxID=167972 RepID=UPI0025DEF586|nr:DUF1304 domain-containing protein [uncultured Enterococcus sp.]